MMSEKELLQAYVTARKRKEELDEQLSAARETVLIAESNLIKAMEANEVESTAKYEEFGRFSLTKPMVFASINREKEKEAFDYLREIGSEDLIKNTIHWKSLSSIVSAKLEENQPVPDCLNYYFKPTIRWEKP